MNTPGFTAGASLIRALRKNTSISFAYSISGEAFAHSRLDRERQRIIPAARDSKEQAYGDCLTDCRLSGAKNCASRCGTATPGPGHGSTPGTSNAQVACCIGFFAECIVSNWGDVFGLAGCFYSASTCTQNAPCNAL